MSGNAHRNRSKKRAQPCPSGCMFCAHRPKLGLYRNTNGHRHNPARKRGGRRTKAKVVRPQ